jgi:methionine sulfoxide reductase heme-binding subunit
VNSQVWWFVARSSGIVAWALLSASVIWGLLLSTKVSTTRIAARRLRPAWLLDLHRHLGGLAVIFTAIHVAGIVADSYVTFGWAEVLVPMASEWRPGAVAFGIVAMYLLVAVEATSLAVRRLPRSMWRWVHRSSFVLYGTATWHGIAAGTDAGNPWFQIASWISIALVLALTIRLVVITRRSPARVAALVEPPNLTAPVAVPAPPAVRAPRLVAPLRAGIAPLPGSVSEMLMPPASIPPAPQRPPDQRLLSPPLPPSTRLPSPPPSPPLPRLRTSLAAADDGRGRVDELVDVSPGGPGEAGFGPPTAGI